MPTGIKIGGKALGLHKAFISPQLGAKTVLTNEPWNFVSLWLTRQKQTKALFYWEQSLEFYKASKGLPLRSAPLLLYYSFMNAAKALMTAKNFPYGSHKHGVARVAPPPGAKRNLRNEGVSIKGYGVLPSLSQYFRESEAETTHTLQELFFNMPFVHRTYCLTFKSQTSMFVPLVDCAYIVDGTPKSAYFSARLSKDHSTHHTINRLPSTLDKRQGSCRLSVSNFLASPRFACRG